ncbi:hypothetical protein [Nocardia brevicatena]|uniref:hypothetical protein n=1 Tax=Nocardia brevicatena TaxID=37327 RepID=UPI0002FA74D5|nr:hypothetical protein [Nocardia brevicatena]
MPNLVVVTADETRGRRAQLVRHALNLLDRNGVAAISGFDLGGEDRFLIDNDHPTPAQDDDFFERIRGLDRVIAAVVELCDAARRIQWVGLGPMSNLAAVVSRLPEIADRVAVPQLGGSLKGYHGKRPVSDTFRTDPTSTGLALRALHAPRLVLGDHTDSDALQITFESPLLQALDRPTAPGWADLLAIHLRAWLARKPQIWLRDLLPLSAALGLPFITFRTERITIHPDAGLSATPHGRSMQVSSAVDYDELLTWTHGPLRQ